MELMTIMLAAGQTKQFEKAGRYFEIIDAAYALDIQFTGANGAISDSMVGALSGLYVEDSFAQFSLTNGAVAQTVRILVMSTGRGGSRRQPGVVQVVDTRSIRTRSEQAFAWRFTATGAAGQYATCTIQNPALSGKRIVINALTLGISLAGAVSFGIALNPVVGVANIAPQSKLSAGAASIATVNQSSTAGLYGGAAFDAMASIFLPASATQYLQLQEPIILQPGAIFGIGAETQAIQIAGMLEYYEEPNT